MATASNMILIREQTPQVVFELWISDQHNLEGRLTGQVDGVASIEKDYLFPDLYQVYVDPRWETSAVVQNVIDYLKGKLGGTVLAGKGTPEVEVVALDLPARVEVSQ